MSGQIPPDFAKSFARARRFEKPAIATMFAVMAIILVAGIMNFFWVAFVAVIFAMPAAWMLNLKCYKCHWVALMRFGTAPDWAKRDQLFNAARSKMAFRFPLRCSKCGAPFVTQVADQNIENKA